MLEEELGWDIVEEEQRMQELVFDCAEEVEYIECCDQRKLGIDRWL